MIGFFASALDRANPGYLRGARWLTIALSSSVCLAVSACGPPLRSYQGYETPLTIEQLTDRDRAQAIMPTRPLRFQYRAPANCNYDAVATPTDSSVGTLRRTETVNLRSAGSRILVVRRLPERILSTTLIDNLGGVQDFNIANSEGRRLTPETTRAIADALRQTGNRNTPYDQTSMWFPALRASILQHRDVVGAVNTADGRPFLEVIFAGMGSHAGRPVVVFDFVERLGARSALVAYSLMDARTSMPVVLVQYVPGVAFVRYEQSGCSRG